MFSISFVVVTVRSRLIGFNRHLEEAAQDLGANAWTTFWRVTLPLIAPGVLAAALLAFALTAPYLLPWYAAWFLPVLALTTDRWLPRIGIILASLLALTQVPAEPGTTPLLLRDMELGVHYGAAAIAVALVVALAAHILREPSVTPRSAESPSVDRTARDVEPAS
jgi:ABC-type glycerol-3-phosphate transport system permease component